MGCQTSGCCPRLPPLKKGGEEQILNHRGPGSQRARLPRFKKSSQLLLEVARSYGKVGGCQARRRIFDNKCWLDWMALVQNKVIQQLLIKSTYGQ